MLVSWVALLATIMCSSGGNTLATWAHRLPQRARPFVIVAAAGIHGFGLLCFSLALTEIPLAIAYPVLIGSTVAIVTLLAVVLFGERLSPRHWGGLALIIGGMVLLHATNPGTAAAHATAGATVYGAAADSAAANSGGAR